MIVTLDSKRRLTVPAGTLQVKPGDDFLVEVDPEEDSISYRRIASRPDWLEVLKSCPVPMEGLPPRRREYFRSRL
jgi:bifunctional DNA-binding transcriptional regulator/antitoxin component of YhaV-PrlF toxin-antitoxin module